MIFKSEGEPIIQRMATPEASPNAIDLGRPFDYRTEVTNDDIVGFQHARATAELNFMIGGERYDTTQKFVSISAAMKQVGLFVPPVSKNIEKKLLVMITNALKTEANASLELSTLIGAFLWDPSLYAKLGWTAKRNLRKLIPNLAEDKEATFPDQMDGLTLVALANYSGQKLISPQTVKRFISIRFEGLHPDVVPARLAERAYARIIGVKDLRPLTAADWASIRTCLQSLAQSNAEQQDSRVLAEAIMHARIINAKEISIDENGLHIVDPDPEVASKARSDTPPPARKHI